MIDILDIFKAVGIAQGAYVVGVTIGIFVYYVRRCIEEKIILWRIFAILISYVTVTIGTIITMVRQVYDPKDIWYWIVFTGYLLGDIALLIMFKYQMKKHRQDKLENKINERKEAHYRQLLEKEKQRNKNL